MNFLRNFLASLLALVLFSVIVVFVLVAVVGGITAEVPVEVKENSILQLKLDKPISEIEYENPLEEIGIFGSSPSTIGLVQLKEAIRQAKDDDNIRGIYLNAPVLQAGLASIEELRNSLESFKGSGKFIVSYGEFYTEGAYYLASVADEIYLHPEGDLELNGLSSTVTFFKGTFEKLDIEPEIFRVGDFKSAVEPFIRKDLSEENKYQLGSLLSDFNHNILNQVAASRGLAVDDIKNISDQMLARNPQEALSLKLVDGLTYQDQVFGRLREMLEMPDGDKIEKLTYFDYNKSFSNYIKADDEVAVIVASGEIISGEGDARTVASEKFSEELKKIREDGNIKAVVLRINSPGGNFLASDVMWRELKLTSEAKPVVASMSDVAASGGYYMSMACDSIIAQSNTITGSIGIFSMLFNLDNFLDNKLGITNETINTGEFSNYINVTRALTEQERRIIQNDLNQAYDTFVTKASEGRHLSVEQIKEIASGRVWSGTQAMENGLVDAIGGLDEAIDMAAELAGIETYKVKYYPKKQSLFEEIFEDFEEGTETKALKIQLGELYPYVESLKRIKNAQGLQARWPYELEIN